MQKYRDHVYQLAAKISADIREDADGIERASTNIRDRIVSIPPITSACEYAIALHELGHLAVPMPYRDDAEIFLTLFGFTGRATLAGEKRAWDWARSQALEWNADMERTYRLALGSYEQTLVQ